MKNTSCNNCKVEGREDSKTLTGVIHFGQLHATLRRTANADLKELLIRYSLLDRSLEDQERNVRTS